MAAGGLAGIGLSPFLGFDRAMVEDIAPPSLILEKRPVVRVLRWMGFVGSDEEIWQINTKRWEEKTGGRVLTDFVHWEEVRSKSALEAVLGAGHDIVFGWFDDPHLYPDKLVDLSDLAVYLGKKYGGWYPVCETYGRDVETRRWIALPVGSAGICLNFRRSWVEEAGFATVPADVQGFLACCKALKAKGHPTGFALGHAVGDANSWTHWWLWAFGGKAVEADGRTIAINSPETRQSLETARELFDTMTAGVENWSDPHNNDAFLDGRISMTANGNSIFYASMLKFPEINRDLMTMNMPVGPVGFPTELSLFSLAFVFRHSSVPNAAKDYLRFLFEAPQYGEWESGTCGFVTPTLRHYYDLVSWGKDQRIAPYRECTRRMLWNGYEGAPGKASAAALHEYVVVDMFADVCMARKAIPSAMLEAEKKLSRLYQTPM